MFSLGRLEDSAAATVGVLELSRASGNVTVETSSLMNLALCTPEDGSAEARRTWSSTLAELHRARNWTNTWTALEALSCDWAERGRVEEALVLARHVEFHGAASPSLQERRGKRDLIFEECPERLGPVRHVGRDEAVAFALEALRSDRD
jgi:hypothetical protein